jgi:hypothetical protein
MFKLTKNLLFIALLSGSYACKSKKASEVRDVQTLANGGDLKGVRPKICGPSKLEKAADPYAIDNWGNFAPFVKTLETKFSNHTSFIANIKFDGFKEDDLKNAKQVLYSLPEPVLAAFASQENATIKVVETNDAMVAECKKMAKEVYPGPACSGYESATKDKFIPKIVINLQAPEGAPQSDVPWSYQVIHNTLGQQVYYIYFGLMKAMPTKFDVQDPVLAALVTSAAAFDVFSKNLAIAVAKDLKNLSDKLSDEVKERFQTRFAATPENLPGMLEKKGDKSSAFIAFATVEILDSLYCNNDSRRLIMDEPQIKSGQKDKKTTTALADSDTIGGSSFEETRKFLLGKEALSELSELAKIKQDKSPATPMWYIESSLGRAWW